MSLIKCPECGKDISDKAEMCINCGYPLSDYLKEVKQKELEEEQEELDKQEEAKKAQYWCRGCYRQNEIGNDYCVFCGMRLTPYYTEEDVIRKPVDEEDANFKGVYKLVYGKKKKVFCTKCGSWKCSPYQVQKTIPGKTKTRYALNLNPLKPFTIINKKEKVIKKEEITVETKFLCNECGTVFD